RPARAPATGPRIASWHRDDDAAVSRQGRRATVGDRQDDVYRARVEVVSGNGEGGLGLARVLDGQRRAAAAGFDGEASGLGIVEPLVRQVIAVGVGGSARAEVHPFAGLGIQRL